MDLISLTYTSRAVPSLELPDVDAIHREALTYNPLDGITGLLVFNGESFMQVIEGAESAIDDLLARLRNDVRHCDIEVRDRRPIAKRFFPNWSMHRIDVDPEDGTGPVEAMIESRADEHGKKMLLQALKDISED